MMLDETTLPAYAWGAAVLGAGGGGSTRTGLLAALQAVAEKGPVPVVGFDDIPDDGIIAPVGGLGSPDITLEKLGNPDQGRWLRDMIERETGGKVAALMPCEIGGANALLPVVWAAHTGLPILDADGMGRAFPEVQMVSMHIAGIPATPSVSVDERDHEFVFRDMDALQLERASRSTAVACGGFLAQIDHVFTGAQARTATVPGTISLALRIGGVLAEAPGDRIRALLDHLGGRAIVTGKVSDVARRTTGGFVRGHALIDGTGPDRGRLVRVEIQNENLVALEEGHVLASVPDILTVLDTQTADAIFTETLRYGQRGTLVALPAPDIWRTPHGLAVAGPRAFGYTFDYQPLAAGEESASPEVSP